MVKPSMQGIQHSLAANCRNIFLAEVLNTMLGGMSLLEQGRQLAWKAHRLPRELLESFLCAQPEAVPRPQPPRAGRPLNCCLKAMHVSIHCAASLFVVFASLSIADCNFEANAGP